MDARHGNVLIIADGERSADRLGRWVASVGEEPLLVHGADTQILERGDDASIDLVVTDLDTDAPDAQRLLDRLLQGHLLFGVPQLHVLRDPSLRDWMQDLNPEVAAIAMTVPSEAGDFQARVRLACEVGRLRRELARAATHDELTGAANRRFLSIRLEQEFSRARRHATPLSLILFGLDQLSMINDRYGLDAGDRALQLLNEILGPHVRTEDVHGRWGDATFAVILTGIEYRGAAIFANNLRGKVASRELPVEGGAVGLRLCAGISYYEGQRTTRSQSELIAAAEHALDEARRRGGNRVFIDEAALTGERPLVVLADSDPALLDAAEDILTLQNYRVMRVENVRALLESLEQRRPDLLVLDLQLDPRADGDPSLLERVQSARPDDPFPVLGLIRADAASSVSPTRTPVDRYLTKPFSVSLLGGVARELLGRAGSDRRGPDGV